MLRFPAPALRTRGTDLLPQVRNEGPAGHGGRGGRADARAASRVALVRPVPKWSVAKPRHCAILCSSFAKRASTGCFREGACSSSRPRNRCWTSIFRSLYSCWWTASPLRRTCTSGWSIPSRSAIANRARSSSRALGGERLRFNERFQCKTCGLEFSQPEPILFSFNSPFGACPRCQGFGNTIDFDMNRVIPDQSLSLDRGRSRSLDQAQVPLLAWQLPQTCAPAGPARRSVLRSDGGRARDRLRLHPPLFRPPGRRRNTSCTCASL